VHVALLVLLICLCLLVVAAALLTRPLVWRRFVVHRRVIVNLRSGSAVSGVLVAQRGGLLFLRNATLHEQGQQVPVDGEAVLERGQVDWIQALNPAEG
jgi:hypothetical protein